MYEDFDRSARYRLLVRLPGEAKGHAVYGSDEIGDIDEKLEGLRFEGLPEGTFVYAVEGVRRDRPYVDKYGVERPRTRRDLGVRVIMRSRIFQVQDGDLARTSWTPTGS